MDAILAHTSMTFQQDTWTKKIDFPAWTMGMLGHSKSSDLEILRVKGWTCRSILGHDWVRVFRLFTMISITEFQRNDIWAIIWLNMRSLLCYEVKWSFIRSLADLIVDWLSASIRILVVRPHILINVKGTHWTVWGIGHCDHYVTCSGVTEQVARQMLLIITCTLSYDHRHYPMYSAKHNVTRHWWWAFMSDSFYNSQGKPLLFKDSSTASNTVGPQATI